MNYNDEILDNKAFKFSKQLVYNIALSICLILVGLLFMVYVLHFGLYEILSNSEYPYFKKGDMIIVKAQKEYEVGDIIKFDQGTLPTSHRLIGIYHEGENTYYICHGDNVVSAMTINDKNDPLYNENELLDWRVDAQYIQSLIDEGKTLKEIQQTARNIQTPNQNVVEGKVVGILANYGTYFTFIKSHYLLLIALVSGIWCIYTCIQNEIYLRKARRFA